MKTKRILCLALALCGNCYAAIIYPKAPAGGREIVREKAGQILLAHPPRAVKSGRVEDLRIAEPYRQYTVGTKDLASGHLLSAAIFSSWRYVLTQGTNIVGMAELRADETGKELGFIALYDSDPALEARQKAGKLPQLEKQDYEFRVLEAKEIYFHAVWLHGKTDDLIIPLPGTFGRWNAYQPYSESQMIKLLKREAKKKLKSLGTID